MAVDMAAVDMAVDMAARITTTTTMGGILPRTAAVIMGDSFGGDAVGSQRCLYLVFEYMDTTVYDEFIRLVRQAA